MVGTVVLPPMGVSPYQALDIWPRMQAANGESWDASSYAQWISTLDGKLATAVAQGRVTKTDRGACSDGVNKLYSYAAGTGFAHVLLIAGVHGDERIGMFAAANWFERFVNSIDPTMALLRKTLKVTYVPFVNPSAFGTLRVNANGVEINRNYDFYWTRYSPPSSEFAKGSSAFSEAESQVIKTIIDKGAVCFIDCHNMGNDAIAQTMQVQAPSSWVIGKRGLCFAAAEIWAQKYGATWADQDSDPDLANPTGVSWSSYYNLWNKFRYNAASVLFECNGNMGGSTTTLLTATAAKNYCGMITTFILTWLNAGQSAPQSQPMVYYGARLTPADTTAMSSGGTMISDTTQRAITLDTFAPFASGGAKDYLEVVFPSPGVLQIHADGYIEGGGSATRRIDVTVSVAQSSDLTSYAVDSNAYASVLVPAAATDRQSFALSARTTLTSLTGDNRARIKLLFQGPASGDNVKVRRARLWAEFFPSSRLQRTPPSN